MIFPKTRTGIWSFWYYQERWYFFFPKKIILFFRRKMKYDLSQKDKWKYDVFFKCSEKMVFPKKNRTEIWSFCNIWKDGISFFSKIWYFFFRRKVKDNLSQEIHGNMIFSVYFINDIILYYTQIWYYPSAKAKIIFSQKNTLKGDISGITEKDDIHPRKYGISVEISYWLTF